MARNLRLTALALAWMAVGAAGCAGLPAPPGPGIAAPAGSPQPSAPVIIQSFASARLRPGDTWRVYLIASDPGGEMENIVSTIQQPGVGTYQASFTPVPSEYGKELNGYISLSTSALDELDGVYLTLTVQIQDRSGAYSQPAEFRVDLNNLYEQEPPPPGIFRTTALGPIMTRVRGPREQGMGPSIFFPRLP